MSCHEENCHDYCTSYVQRRCPKKEKPPYACNNCSSRNKCKHERYIYSAKNADAAVGRRRSESRTGIRISSEELKELDELLVKLVKKGQPLVHIYEEHKEEIPVGLRSLYNYIDSGEMSVRNIDLRRKTGYRQRKIKKTKSERFDRMHFREGRTYEDFLKLNATDYVEMDTVKGQREKGKRLLTMIFTKNSIMLMILMPDGSADSVKMVFDYLESGLGTERFMRLFPLILTDNGSEFKRVNDLELCEAGQRTSIYYCDPMASWQKPHIEKNHEFIRYVVPKGKSFSPFLQEDMTLLSNNINSVKRENLNGLSPFECVDNDDEDFAFLFQLLKMHPIPADEVHLKPDLLTKK